MKRTALLRQAQQIANAAGTTFDFVREGGAHSVYSCNSLIIPIPRHREINEITAKAILRTVTDAAHGD